MPPFEPDATDYMRAAISDNGGTPEGMALERMTSGYLMSIAISLKRLADTICPDPEGLRSSMALTLNDIELTLRKNL